ncbi:cyclic nucleotide-binding domain-containing protein, partial [bacterium]|nr:cyclic nucleotide-binding domain-containing protein [bacterium]
FSFSLEKRKTFNVSGIKIRGGKIGDHWNTAFRFDDISFEDSDEIDEYTGNLIILRGLSIFSEFQDEELLYVLRSGKKLNVSSDAVIFFEGTAGKSLYVIFDGKVKIYKTRRASNAGKEQFISFIYPGEFFGEMALLKEIPRCATALAVADSVLFRIDKDSLDDLLTRRADIAVKLYRTFISALIERLQIVDHDLADSPFTELHMLTKF